MENHAKNLLLENPTNKKSTNCFCIIVFIYSSLYEYVIHIATTLMKQSTRVYGCVGKTQAP